MAARKLATSHPNEIPHSGKPSAAPVLEPAYRLGIDQLTNLAAVRLRSLNLGQGRAEPNSICPKILALLGLHSISYPTPIDHPSGAPKA